MDCVERQCRSIVLRRPSLTAVREDEVEVNIAGAEGKGGGARKSSESSVVMQVRVTFALLGMLFRRTVVSAAATSMLSSALPSTPLSLSLILPHSSSPSFFPSPSPSLTLPHSPSYSPSPSFSL